MKNYGVEMRPMSKAKVLLGLIGIMFLVWGIGVLTRIWANPLFASFWVISNGVAEVLSYVGTGIGGLLLSLAVMVYYQNTNRRTSKIFAAASSQTFKPAMPELYEENWQKKPLQQTEADKVEYPPFVIINGRRTNLGSEEMEKIVD
jgi:hypothetical protein